MRFVWMINNLWPPSKSLGLSLAALNPGIDCFFLFCRFRFINNRVLSTPQALLCPIASTYSYSFSWNPSSTVVLPFICGLSAQLHMIKTSRILTPEATNFTSGSLRFAFATSEQLPSSAWIAIRLSGTLFCIRSSIHSINKFAMSNATPALNLSHLCVHDFPRLFSQLK